MPQVKVNTNPKVETIFSNYPKHVSNKMLILRNLIIETANEIGITQLEETLKWNEPSYLTKNGSTIRIDWKSKTPEQYGMYFQCTSRLIPTFKTIHKNAFEFEGNRAIVFQLDKDIPVAPLKSCIKTALTYHNVKHLPLLGL